MTFLLAYWKYLAGAAVVIGFVAAWSIHGETRYRAGIAAQQDTDRKALVEAQKAADAKSAALQAKVDKAAQEASDALKKYDAYVAAYPLGTVRVCHSASLSPLPKTASSSPGSQNTGTGPAVIPPVPAGTAGPDISAGLDSLMRAAARLWLRLLSRKSAVNNTWVFKVLIGCRYCFGSAISGVILMSPLVH